MGFTRILNRILSATPYSLIRTRSLQALRQKADNPPRVRFMPSPDSGRRLRALAQYLKPRQAAGFKKTRLGRANDGGYVCLDDFADLDGVLSLGIGGDVSFDLDLAARGLAVFQYDHTVAAPPAAHPNFRFFRTRVVAGEQQDGSIPAILKHHGLTGRASILKMDIEGDEWPVLDALPAGALACFSQVVCEFHGFAEVADRQWFERAELVLRKLDEAFAVVHVHANNYSPMLIAGGVAFPDVLEVSYASRRRYTFVDSDEEFPTELDSPNECARDDYFLGRFAY